MHGFSQEGVIEDGGERAPSMISLDGTREEHPVARRRPSMAAERPSREIIEGTRPRRMRCVEARKRFATQQSARSHRLRSASRHRAATLLRLGGADGVPRSPEHCGSARQITLSDGRVTRLFSGA